MQYVRSISGSVSKTWNSINPATLSGAIDVIVVEQEDGTLSCSPFHVRFGKFSLLRPSDKKVEFKVNNVKQDYAMKLGEGGEAFFVFETSADVPDNLKTSPLVSAASSPAQSMSTSLIPDAAAQEPEPLSLDDAAKAADPTKPHHGSLTPMLIPQRHVQTDLGPDASLLSQSFPHELQTMSSTSLPEHEASGIPGMSGFVDDLSGRRLSSFVRAESANIDERPKSSPSNGIHSDAVSRAMALSKKLWSSNIASQVTDTGDLMLDMTGYKSTEEGVIQAELVARKILAEEVEGVTDIGSLISPDEKGNLWIYSSEEAKLAATRKMAMAGLNPVALLSSDALSDPGYHSSDDMESQKSGETSDRRRERAESESVTTLTTPPLSPNPMAVDSGRSYAKTLRLTSDQLRALDLKPGPNTMSFSVNRATCQAYMFLWKQNVPIVISDIDGTITKSDALGHVLNMIGRDWTHLGVAKLYSDIVLNGYNILYLTSRSVGQADTTRAYIAGIVQEGHRLPKGPVILSPDRTMAALRREIYLRQPEVFKMACLRDIMSLFNQRESPFYAGFGNRLTDALSYRSVNIPSTRIFTINSNAEVSLDLMSLNKYKTGYSSMREIVDHYFPPIGMLVQEGGEEYTDFNYWRDKPLDVDDISETDSDGGGALTTIMSEDYGDDDVFSDDLNESYISRDSMDDSLGPMVRPSIEVDRSGRLARLSSHDTLAEESEEDEEGDDIDELDLVAAAAADRSSSARRSSRSSNLESLHRELSHNRPNRSGSTSSTTAHARRASTSSRK